MKKKISRKYVIIGIILAILIVAFFIYTGDYYRADKNALIALKGEQNIKFIDNLTVLYPDEPSSVGMIFYPGGKVEAKAYIPLLEKLREQGITSVLVKMPFNLAVFNSDAADEVYAKVPSVTNWFICGHSLGGAMASKYFGNNKDKLHGVILLGAYIVGDVSDKDALTIYGTFNSNLEENIDYTNNIVIIDGGNHAQFGNYGKQKGDPDATISSDDQQNQAVTAIMKFIKDRL